MYIVEEVFLKKESNHVKISYQILTTKSCKILQDLIYLQTHNKIAEFVENMWEISLFDVVS